MSEAAPPSLTRMSAAAAGTMPSPALQTKRQALLAAGVFALASAVLYTAIINDDWVDSFIHFRYGERIARGEVIYRDFFQFWFPGAPLLLGYWMKIFGPGMDSLRALLALCGGATITVGWIAACRTISGPLRHAAPLMLAAAWVIGNEGMNHMLFSTLLALIAMLAALIACERDSPRCWFFAGLAAALAGMFTLGTGALLGLALCAAAAIVPGRSRLQAAVATASGGAVVLLILVAWLALHGLFSTFVYSTLTWPLERYAPFHAGVNAGAWLPPWAMLGHIPWPWKPTWLIALAAVWGRVYVLPLVLPASLIFLIRRKGPPQRLVLLVSAGALVAAAYPNNAPMRLMRLSPPLLLLLLFELSQSLSALFADRAEISGQNDGAALPARSPQKTQAPLGVTLHRAAAIALSAASLLVLPLQWSYRSQLEAVETPRGTVLLKDVSALEFRALARALPAGSRVGVLPEYRPAAWLLKLDNATRYDSLLPVMFSPRQLREAAEELQHAGCPPLIRFEASPYSHLESIREIFGPSRHLDEWDRNPFSDLLRDKYAVAREDGPVQILLPRESLK